MDPQRGNGNLFCCCFQKTLSGSKKGEKKKKSFLLLSFWKYFTFCLLHLPLLGKGMLKTQWRLIEDSLKLNQSWKNINNCLKASLIILKGPLVNILMRSLRGVFEESSRSLQGVFKKSSRSLWWVFDESLISL